MLEIAVGFGATLLGLFVVVGVIVLIKWMVDTGFMEFLACLTFALAMIWGIILISRDTGRWIMETATEQREHSR